MVDTCAGEFESTTPYYYGTYESENESVVTDKEILSYRFRSYSHWSRCRIRYATVHAVWAIQDAGYEAMV